MSRAHRLVLIATIGLLLPAMASAVTVTDIKTLHRDGQTFLTWQALPGTGWRYTILSSDRPIQDQFSLENCLVEGEVGDSTWCDLRLSRLRGTPYAYRIDPELAPLASDRGLFVVTTPYDRRTHYAVTARLGTEVQTDMLFVDGRNTMSAPVTETVARPAPVYQRTIPGAYGGLVDVYTLWTTNQATPEFPAMSSTAGMAYDCGIIRGSGSGPFEVRGHGRGGNFLHACGRSFPGSWVLGVDDYLPNPEVATFYFGYHEGYDPTSTLNRPPTAGYVHAYTYARLLYLMDWAEASFPVDRQRVYAMGGSMGGSMAMFLALNDPDRIAAAWASVPKVDLADFVDSALNPTDFTTLWGDVSANLPTEDGLSVYQRLSAPWLAANDPGRDLPPIHLFSGRNDIVVGWSEKVRLMSAFEGARRGGAWFWDERTHASTGDWQPLMDHRVLERYRRDLSYPAFSSGSLDSDPGNGSASSGDLVGTMNGHYDWDPNLTDRPELWAVTLKLVDLPTLAGTRTAPDVATVTVTPRRLQQFEVVPGRTYFWDVKRLEGMEVVQSGTVTPDALGLLSIPGVQVHRNGSWLRIRSEATVGVEPAPGTGGGMMVRLDRAPVVGPCHLSIRWPAGGDARVSLHDVAGRELKELYRGAATGTTRLAIDGSRLPAGVYFARATQGTATESLRFVVLR